MEIIIKKPREGKTTELIKRCAEHGGYIVSATQMRAKATFKMAKDMGYNIPFPLTFAEFLRGEYNAKGIKRLYIDDAHELAQAIARSVEVAAITVDDWGGMESSEREGNKSPFGRKN